MRATIQATTESIKAEIKMLKNKNKIKCSRSFLVGAQFGLALSMGCFKDTPEDTYMKDGLYVYKGEELEFEDNIIEMLSGIDK